MATLTLFGRDGEVTDELPQVCVCCGQKATSIWQKKFSWHPPWVYVLILVHVLIFLIVALVMRKSMTAWLPVCQRHRSPWLWRHLLTAFTLIYLIGGPIALLILGDALQQQLGRQDNTIVFLWLGWLAGFIAVIVLLLVVNYSTIRPTEITERRLVLAGVSQLFVEGLEGSLEPEPYSNRRPPRKESQEEIDDYPEPDDRIRSNRPRRPHYDE